VDIDTELLIYRVMAIIGITGMIVTLTLAYLGIFREWGTILTMVFGVISLVPLINGASRRGVKEVLSHLMGLGRDLRADIGGLRSDLLAEQRRTNATLERIEQILRRAGGRPSAAPPAPSRPAAR
jgi:hypothetical protein